MKLPGRGRRDEELEEEIQGHLRMAARERVERGEAPERAEAAALREFGNVVLVKEVTREMWGRAWLRQLAQDLSYGLRTMRRAPGFTAVAVLTLALGIGANTTIFSVVNGVLLKSLPYPEPERLVALNETSKETQVMAVAFPDYLDWRAGQSVFENLAARMPAGGVLTGDGEPERVTGRLVTASFFTTLGVSPAAGRFFTEEEDRPGAERVMVLSYGLWQSRYGRDPEVVGRGVEYNGESWTIVGVTPAGFDFYGQNNLNNQFFIPLGRLSDQEYMRDRNSHTVFVTGRLKHGVGLERARAEMETLAARLGERFPESNKGNGVRLRPLLEDYVGEARPALLVLMSAVALVLLIACANVANLLLGRAAARQKEVAVRMALGAGRMRVVRQLLTESLLLAALGGTGGLLLSVWGVGLLVRLNPEGMPRLENIALDARTLVFTLLVTSLTGVVFGLTPALQTSKVDFHDALKEGGLRSTWGAGGRRLRGALVVAEVSLALVLLAGTGLLVKSFWRLMRVEPGFDPAGVLTLRLRLPDGKYRDVAQTTAFLKEVKRRVAALPGVRSVSVTGGFPFGRADDSDYLLEGQPEPGRPDEWPTCNRQSVDEDYYQTLGISLLAGRYFNERDAADASPVVIVDDAFTRRNFAGLPPEAALGKRLRFGGDGEPWREIVGVVRHVRQSGLDEEGRVQVYRPWTQVNPKWVMSYTRAMDMVVKSSGEPAALVAPIKREVQALDKDLPLANVRTLDALVAQTLAPRLFSLAVLGVFSLIALLLGAVGLYGVLSYVVTQRTREIGIRLALGAQRRDVLRLVVGQGMTLVCVGLGLGLVGGLAAVRLLEGLLFGVTAADPATFAGISILLGLVSLAACLVPAWRATKIDPLVALRYE